MCFPSFLAFISLKQLQVLRPSRKQFDHASGKWKDTDGGGAFYRQFSVDYPTVFRQFSVDYPTVFRLMLVLSHRTVPYFHALGGHEVIH